MGVTAVPLWSAKALDGLTIANGPVTGTIRQAIVSASVSLSASEASTLTLVVADDPQLSLLRGGFLALRTVIGIGPEDRRRYWTVAFCSLTGTADAPTITAVAQPHQVMTLRDVFGPATWSNISPSTLVQQVAGAYGVTRFAVEPTPVRPTIVQAFDDQTKESAWDLFQRLASETGCQCYVDDDTLYFGRPTWLAEQFPWTVLDRAELIGGGWVTMLPAFTEASTDKTIAAAVTLSLQLSRVGWDRLGLGQVVSFTGFGAFDRAYAATGLEVTLDDVTPPAWTLTAPVDPIVSDPALAAAPRLPAARWRLAYPTVDVDPDPGCAYVWPAKGELRTVSTADGAQIYGLAGSGVYAPAGGLVDWVVRGSTCIVQIKVSETLVFRLSHLVEPTVAAGQRVARGVRVGQLPPPGPVDSYVTVQMFGWYGQLFDMLGSGLFPIPAAS